MCHNILTKRITGIIIMVMIIGTGIFSGCQKDTKDDTSVINSQLVTSQLKSSGFFYDAVIDAQNDVISHYAGVDMSTVSQNDFMQFFVDAYTMHLPPNVPDFASYPAPLSSEYIYFENAISCLDYPTYAQCKSAVASMLAAVSTYPLSTESKDRLVALLEMVDATCDIDVSPLLGNFHKEKTFEEKLTAEIRRLMVQIEAHPVKMAAFVCGLPTSYIWLVAEATYMSLIRNSLIIL